MALLGSIIAFWKSDASGFVKETKKAHKELSVLEQISHKAEHALGLFGIALGAHALVHGAMHLAESVIENNSALTGLSHKTGITVQSLSELQYAAKASHLDFEELTGTIKKFTLNLAEAATSGKGESFEALEQLHLSATALANDPEAFQKTVKALAGVEDQTTKVAIATKLFGAKTALNILPLAQSKNGLAELSEEARKLGVSLSGQQSEALNAAHEATVKLQAAVQGLATTYTVALAPTLEVIADKLTGITQQANQASQELGPRGLTQAQETWSDFLAVVSTVDFVLEYLGGGITAIGLRIEELVGHLLRLVPATREAGNALLDSLKPAQEALGKQLRDLVDRKSLQEQYEDKVRDRLHHGGGEHGEGGHPFMPPETNDGVSKTAKTVDELTKKLEEQRATFGMTAIQAEQYRIAMMDIPTWQKMQILGITHEIEKLQEEKELTDEINKAHEEFAERRAKFLEEIESKQERYNRLLEEAKELAHTPEELAKAQKKIHDEVFGSDKEEGLGLPRGLKRGSQEARMAELEYKFGRRSEDHAKKTADHVENIDKNMANFLGGLGVAPKRDRFDLDVAIPRF